MRLALALIALANPAAAAPHFMHQKAADEPCGAILEMIDNASFTPDGLGSMTLAFGYLLGFEAATGGDLSGEYETVLKRFRAMCGENAEATGLELLQSME